jgi:hypothetical protein
MNQKKVTQFYVISLVWITWGCCLSSTEVGIMKDVYALTTIIIGFCAIEFFYESKKKILLSEITALFAIIGISIFSLFF